jgi:hypothetical protein
MSSKQGPRFAGMCTPANALGSRHDAFGPSEIATEAKI